MTRFEQIAALGNLQRDGCGPSSTPGGARTIVHQRQGVPATMKPSDLFHNCHGNHKLGETNRRSAQLGSRLHFDNDPWNQTPKLSEHLISKLSTHDTRIKLASHHTSVSRTHHYHLRGKRPPTESLG